MRPESAPTETMVEPGYVALHRSGELERRARALEKRLAPCTICPRDCGVDRLRGEPGFCHSGFLPIVSSACVHHGEEPAISGTRGSGTVFFANCNMRCVYCQNHQISQDFRKQRHNETGFHSLAERMLYLQGLGCHNINLVTPSHCVPQILRALVEAVPMGLRIPLVYNTSGYDSVATLEEMDGIVDIYLPDIRYASSERAKECSGTADYPVHARRAIKEMYRQAGDLAVDADGVAERGVIVRHLILPHDIAGSRESLTWLAQEVSATVTVSIMSQYTPLFRAKEVPGLSRTILQSEYETVVDLVDELGLQNGWIQEMGAAGEYVPDFEREGSPFTPG